MNNLIAVIGVFLAICTASELDADPIFESPFSKLDLAAGQIEGLADAISLEMTWTMKPVYGAAEVFDKRADRLAARAVITEYECEYHVYAKNTSKHRVVLPTANYISYLTTSRTMKITWEIPSYKGEALKVSSSPYHLVELDPGDTCKLASGKFRSEVNKVEGLNVMVVIPNKLKLGGKRLMTGVCFSSQELRKRFVQEMENDRLRNRKNENED